MKGDKLVNVKMTAERAAWIAELRRRVEIGQGFARLFDFLLTHALRTIPTRLQRAEEEQ